MHQYEFARCELSEKEREHIARVQGLMGGPLPYFFTSALPAHCGDVKLRVMLDPYVEAVAWGCSLSIGQHFSGPPTRAPEADEICAVLARFCRGWTGIETLTLGAQGEPPWVIVFAGKAPAGWKPE